MAAAFSLILTERYEWYQFSHVALSTKVNEHISQNVRWLLHVWSWSQETLSIPDNPLVVRSSAPSWCLALTWRYSTQSVTFLQLIDRVHSPAQTQNLTTNLLLETLVVTAVTEAREMVSGSNDPARRIAFLSRSSMSRIAGSSGELKWTKSTIKLWVGVGVGWFH